MEIYFREPSKIKSSFDCVKDISLPLLNDNDEVVAEIYIPVNGKTLSLNLADLQHSKIDTDIYAIDVKLIKDSRANHYGHCFLLIKRLKQLTESCNKIP